MMTHVHDPWAQRLGQKMGRGWRAYERRERRVVGGLAMHGFSAGVARALLWGIKLIVLGVLLYVAFWLAVLLVFVAVAAWILRNTNTDDEVGEWRHGPEGYGYYEHDIRTDYGRVFEDDRE